MKFIPILAEQEGRRYVKKYRFEIHCFAHSYSDKRKQKADIPWCEKITTLGITEERARNAAVNFLRDCLKNEHMYLSEILTCKRVGGGE